MDDGQSLLYVDLHLVHEVTSPQAFSGLAAAGRRVRRPDRTFATVDHNVPTTARNLPITDALALAMINALPPATSSRVQRSKYIPSLAYRIGMVADGALDATFVKPNSRDWDLAAADLILHEAGGAILDEHGMTPSYAGPDTAHGALVCGAALGTSSPFFSAKRYTAALLLV